MKDIQDMNGLMGACVGIVDAISAGQNPEVKEKVRKRTVCEVASFVRLFKKAGSLVAFLERPEEGDRVRLWARRWPP